MRALNAVVVIVAVVMVAGRYFQERWSLSVIRQLPGERARDRYEAMRRGTDRVLMLVTALLASSAVGAIIYYVRFLSAR
jgi:hypothetical protein